MTHLLIFLDEIEEGHLRALGGKAVRCGLLRQAGLPVPAGFVVDPASVAVDPGPLLQALQQLRGPLAVRSSAADEDGTGDSFAGLHLTRLEVAHGDVREAVAACWASLYSREALAYRLARGLPTFDLRMGVLVQEMVAARVSGVAFTADPAGARETLHIDLAPGQCEPIANGRVRPEEIRVERSTGRALGGRPAMSASQLRALTDLLLQVEELMGMSCDVEWCFDGDRFWVMQARPITGPAAGRNPSGITWTRANFLEVLPELAPPQVVEPTVRLFDQAMRRHYDGLIAPRHELGPCLASHCGRLYLNQSQLAHLAESAGADAGDMLEAVGETRTRSERRSAWLRNIPALARLAVRYVTAMLTMKRYFRRQRAQIAKLQGPRLREVSDARLEEALGQFEESAPEELERGYALSGMMAFQAALGWVCDRAGEPFENVFNAMLATGEKTVSACEAFDLVALARAAHGDPKVRDVLRRLGPELAPNGPLTMARIAPRLADTGFLPLLERYLERYGHRGPHESDWSLPRYAEDVRPVLYAVAELALAPEVPDPAAVEARHAEAAQQVWQRIRGPLNGVGRWLVRLIKWHYLMREEHRFEFTRLLSAWRPWHLEAARRFAQRGWIQREDDYFFLLLEESRAALRGEIDPPRLRARIVRRRAEREAFAGLSLPLSGTSAELAAALLSPHEAEKAAEQPSLMEAWSMRGVSLSRGSAEGRVVVLRTAADLHRVKPGNVLVSRSADTAWAPFLVLASAFVVEVGGRLSHAATVARELGVPAVAGVSQATHVLRDGDYVRVDGDKGVIEVLTPLPAAGTSQ